MSGNTLGTLFCVTSFGESHGPAIGCVADGCPPGMALAAADIQRDLDRRKPGTSRHVTQRRESDTVEIYAAIGTEVEIDRATGQPTIKRAAMALETGRIVNPIMFQGQIDGGLIQGY